MVSPGLLGPGEQTCWQEWGPQACAREQAHILGNGGLFHARTGDRQASGLWLAGVPPCP